MVIIFIWIVLILVFLYTFGFCIMLWKEKNKFGAFGVLLLIAGTVTASIYSIIK